jgi:hypothetical protein
MPHPSLNRRQRSHAQDGFVRAGVAPGDHMASFAPFPHRVSGSMASFAPIPAPAVVSVALFVASHPLQPPPRPPSWQGWVRSSHFSRREKPPFWQRWLRSRGFHAMETPENPAIALR